MLPLLAILAATISTFVTSTLIHMVLTYHHADYVGLPIAFEDALLAILREHRISPNNYTFPYVGRPKDWEERVAKGPIGSLKVRPGAGQSASGSGHSMNRELILWFFFLFGVAAAAYLARHVVKSEYADVGVFALTFLTHFGGDLNAYIWEMKKLDTIARHVVDCLLYSAVMTAVYYLVA
jgi:hypothetical protein